MQRFYNEIIKNGIIFLEAQALNESLMISY